MASAAFQGGNSHTVKADAALRFLRPTYLCASKSGAVGTAFCYFLFDKVYPLIITHNVKAAVYQILGAYCLFSSDLIGLDMYAVKYYR